MLAERGARRRFVSGSPALGARAAHVESRASRARIRRARAVACSPVPEPRRAARAITHGSSRARVATGTPHVSAAPVSVPATPSPHATARRSSRNAREFRGRDLAASLHSGDRETRSVEEGVTDAYPIPDRRVRRGRCACPVATRPRERGLWLQQAAAAAGDGATGVRVTGGCDHALSAGQQEGQVRRQDRRHGSSSTSRQSTSATSPMGSTSGRSSSPRLSFRPVRRRSASRDPEKTSAWRAPDSR